MKKIAIILLAILPLVFMSCSGSKKSKTRSSSSKKTSTSRTAVNFVNSNTLSNVLDKAKAKNKLVFVDFYTNWCLPCRMMDEDVFSDRKVAKFLNDNFINYKVNAEKGNGANLAFVYEVSNYPTLLFMDEKGRVLEKKVGAAYHTELMEMAKRALAAQGN